MKKKDMDLEDCKLKIVQGKGSKDRVVMLPEVMKPIVQKWMRIGESEYFLHAIHDKELPLSVSYLTQRFTEALKRSNLRLERFQTLPLCRYW